MLKNPQKLSWTTFNRESTSLIMFFINKYGDII